MQKFKNWRGTDDPRLAVSIPRVKKHLPEFRIGDRVKVVRVPRKLSDAAGIGTPAVFKRALGRIFRIEGFGPYGHLELVISRRDTIWIEPEFVVRVESK